MFFLYIMIFLISIIWGAFLVCLIFEIKLRILKDEMEKAHVMVHQGQVEQSQLVTEAITKFYDWITKHDGEE